MQTETWIDKSNWPDGPWQHEPDRVEWRAGDLALLARRHLRHGIWCGYVGLRPGHPWHGLDYEKVEQELTEAEWVHGGLTYSEPCEDDELADQRELVCHVPAPGEPDGLWWLGFDCGHLPDYRPGVAMLDLGLEAEHTVYRDLEYVRHQCEILAGAAARVAG